MIYYMLLVGDGLDAISLLLAIVFCVMVVVFTAVACEYCYSKFYKFYVLEENNMQAILLLLRIMVASLQIMYFLNRRNAQPC